MIDPDDIDPELLARFREYERRYERRKEENRSKRKERGEEINQKWGQLEQKLLAALEQNVGAYKWVKEGPVPGGTGYLDIRGRAPVSGRWVGIELEKDRTTCVRNVNKVWMAIDRAPKDFVLIQIFSPVFDENTKNTTKKQGAAEAKFTGSKAAVDTGGHLAYVPMQLKHWPSEDSTLVRELVDSIRPLLPQ